nr:MAG TPA: hypothetical protein [Caudoviricetes sp.]
MKVSHKTAPWIGAILCYHLVYKVYLLSPLS